MSRILRSRQPSLKVNSETKTEKSEVDNSRVIASKQLKKVKITRSSKKTQDENIAPQSKVPSSPKSQSSKDVHEADNSRVVASKKLKKVQITRSSKRTQDENIAPQSKSSFNVNVVPEEVIPSKKIALRPRQDVKICSEKSKVASSPKNQSSKDVHDKIPSPPGKKVPIWKTIQFPEAKTEHKDVYEISDSDLSLSENPKKRKKAAKKKPPKRLKKAVGFFMQAKKESVKKTANKKPKAEKGKKSAAPIPTKPEVVSREQTHPTRVDPKPKLISQIPTEPKLIPPTQTVSKPEVGEKLISQIPREPEFVLQVRTEPPASFDVEPNSQVHHKPKLVSVEVLGNRNKVSFVPTVAPQPGKEFRPFRVTQNFRAKSTMQPNMSDHSLLAETMSPIAKETENVDFSTPWRLPHTSNFSRVRNLVQSTPQTKIAGLLSRQTILDKSKERKSTSVVELGNKTQPEVGGDLTTVNSKPEDGKVLEIPYVPSPAGASVRHSFPEDVEDKENAAPNRQSPQTSPKKKKVLGTPVFEPQPGPSGLQKQPLRELRVLRQVNLNDFLNLDDKPERTEIRTRHGIFDDVASTPINGKFVKKTAQMDIENDFGFDDDDDDNASLVTGENEKSLDDKLERTEIRAPHGIFDDFASPPINDKFVEKTMQMDIENDFGFDDDASSVTGKKEKPVQKGLLQKKKENVRPRQKSELKKPVRLVTEKVLREVRHCRVKQEEKERQKRGSNREKEEIVPCEENLIKGPVKEAAKTNAETETTDFSDTFDLLKEQINEKDDEKQTSRTPPLFEDLEPPTHFVAPPKSMYKRKRTPKFSFSEGSDDDENRNEVQGRAKKSKSKKSKKEDKKFTDWAKSINKTFEEIDKFDLLVE